MDEMDGIQCCTLLAEVRCIKHGSFKKYLKNPLFIFAAV